MSVVTHRPELTEKLMALSFDDGPSRQTPAILDVLAAHGALGTFFILGERVAGKEEILGRILAEGHEIGNHTFSHPHALDLDDGELEHDIARCQRLLTAAEPVLMRPPYGEDPIRTARLAAARGLPTTALWSIDPKDFIERDGAEIARVIETEAAPGAIIDLHDGWPRVTSTARDRTPTIEALDLVIPRLTAKGYRFVTISQLLAA
jgi:peptidoglycan-N-acetylglucosamine deacetylase